LARAGAVSLRQEERARGKVPDREEKDKRKHELRDVGFVLIHQHQLLLLEVNVLVERLRGHAVRVILQFMSSRALSVCLAEDVLIC